MSEQEHARSFVDELRRRGRLIERSDVVSAELLSRAATHIERSRRSAPAQVANMDRSDAEWIEGPDGARLQLSEAYYGDGRRVFLAVLSLSRVEVTQAEVESWTLEQRKAAAEYALSVHFSASDHEDVIVPPRPDFLRRIGEAA